MWGVEVELVRFSLKIYAISPGDLYEPIRTVYDKQRGLKPADRLGQKTPMGQHFVAARPPLAERPGKHLHPQPPMVHTSV